MEGKTPRSVNSSAFNFKEFVLGGVDPRTGIYTCSLPLGELCSGGLNGPSLALVLNFNPLDSVDSGFGAGWSLPLTRYVFKEQKLILSSGEQYRTSETPDAVYLQEMKLETVKVIKTADSRYEVRHKNGLREELSVYGSSGIAVTTKIIGANGACIDFIYGLFNDAPALSEIRDGERSLLKIARKSSRVSLVRYPETPSQAEFLLNIIDDRVASIKLPFGKWDLSYEDIGGIGYLNKVVSPLGAREIIAYDADGHLALSDDLTDSLPYVSAHMVYPGQGQASISKTYVFSDWNFLGYGAEVDWDVDGDPLYQADWGYQYTSTERVMKAGKVHSHIKRTYNKFHLLIEQVEICGNAEKSVATQYHCIAGKNFNEQPAQFRLPLVQKLRYKNRKTGQVREEITTTEYDISGNLLKHVAANGLITLSEYYPAEGAAGCPADPLGFVRFEKQRTVIPAPGFAPAAALLMSFSYQALGSNDSGVAKIVLSGESIYERAENTDTLRSQTTLSYIDLPASSEKHGLLQRKALTLNGHTTRHELDYSRTGQILEVQTTQVGFDGSLKISSQSFSTVDGLKLSEKNEDNGHIHFTYDLLGRVLSETVAAGTLFQATRTSQYQTAQDGAPAVMLATDPNGVQQRTCYDGLGRVISIEEQDCDQVSGSTADQLRQVYAASYDALGQLESETQTDWWLNQQRALVTRFVFDDWGHVKTTQHPDGRKAHHTYDPIRRSVIEGVEGAGKSETISNAFEKPESVQLFDSKGNALGKRLYEYDGVGRSVAQTDPVGNRTAFEYDMFNRLTRSVLPDGSAVQTQYAPHSQDALPIQVKVADRTLGQQRFDGLGRLVESSCGGRTTTSSYDAGFDRPLFKQMADGERIEYLHERHLAGKVTQRKSKELMTRYEYEPKLGQLIKCVEQGRETRLEYYRSGRLKQETSTVDKASHSLAYTYTLCGRPLSCTDVIGEVHQTEYDSWGRPVTFDQSALKASFTYNALGQLAVVNAQEQGEKHSMATRFAYDDLGREVSREFEIDGSDNQVLTSSYTLASKLARKTLKQGSEVLRDEHFTYDARGRLQNYSCTGTQRPRDAQGKVIDKQTYTFDAFDNIVTLLTVFPGGENLASFEYSIIDPTQLVGITNSHADYPAPVSLQYEANGSLIKDEQARSLTYDAFGRLSSVADASGTVIRGYHYDALDRLVELSRPGGQPSGRHYRGSSVINEICGATSQTSLSANGILLARHQSGVDAGTRLLGVDQQQTVLTEATGSFDHPFAYSPYGFRPAEGGLFGLLGFNGEQLDSLTGLYLLGSYRAYSPGLMRFLGPDSLSPFGAGGLNPYAYCAGDPINRIDPTGHSWQNMAGIAGSVVGFGLSMATMGAPTPLAVIGLVLAGISALLGIASHVIEDHDPGSEVAEILGWASFATGMFSAVAGLRAAGLRAADKGLINSKNTQPVQYMKGGKGKQPPNSAKLGKGGRKNLKAAQAGPAAEAEPQRWTLTGLGVDDIPADLLGDQAAEAKKFIEGISVSGLHPRAASDLMIRPRFENYNGNPNLWTVRVGIADRISLSVDKKNFIVKILTIGGHP